MTPSNGAIEGLALALGKTLGVVGIGYVMGSMGFCDPAAGKGFNLCLSTCRVPLFAVCYCLPSAATLCFT